LVAPRWLLALEPLPRLALLWLLLVWDFLRREPRVALVLAALRRVVRSEPRPISSSEDDRLDWRRGLELPDDLSPRGMNGLLWVSRLPSCMARATRRRRRRAGEASGANRGSRAAGARRRGAVRNEFMRSCERSDLRNSG